MVTGRCRWIHIVLTLCLTDANAGVYEEVVTILSGETSPVVHRHVTLGHSGESYDSATVFIRARIIQISSSGISVICEQHVYRAGSTEGRGIGIVGTHIYACKQDDPAICRYGGVGGRTGIGRPCTRINIEVIKNIVCIASCAGEVLCTCITPVICCRIRETYIEVIDIERYRRIKYQELIIALIAICTRIEENIPYIRTGTWTSALGEQGGTEQQPGQ